jgi:phenylacetate-coenzyme A ligase PaaK-like adenylate-forming protein
MICAPSAVHATGSAPEWTAGPAMPIRFVGVPATLPLPEIVDRLNALQAPALAGYPTMLARLAAEQRVGRLHIAPRSISSTSETLHPELRAAIVEGFGAPIVDMFGSTEGLVGVSAPDDEVLVFNSDVCIIELVDDENRPVPVGTPSAKVLLTNLSNRVQPLIRYEMTDRFVRRPDAPNHGHLRATVDGRCDALLRYNGVDVDPLVLRTVMVRSPDVLDYQVRQTRRGIDVAALAVSSLDVDRLSTRLAHALEHAGLTDPQVTVRAVATLERHHETGKLRRFLPLS